MNTDTNLVHCSQVVVSCVHLEGKGTGGEVVG